MHTLCVLQSLLGVSTGVLRSMWFTPTALHYKEDPVQVSFSFIFGLLKQQEFNFTSNKCYKQSV